MKNQPVSYSVKVGNVSQPIPIGAYTWGIRKFFEKYFPHLGSDYCSWVLYLAYLFLFASILLFRWRKDGSNVRIVRHNERWPSTSTLSILAPAVAEGPTGCAAPPETQINRLPPRPLNCWSGARRENGLISRPNKNICCCDFNPFYLQFKEF